MTLSFEFKGKEATRNGYGRGIKELGKLYDNVVAIDADLASSTKSLALRDVAPERFFYAGICEQNTIGTAVGLALEGMRVFASSFAMFITGRAYEIIRQSVCYANVPVRIIGSHAGIFTGEDGPTAQATEDVSLMRTLPNMHVIVPADYTEAYKATLFLGDFEKPSYLRTNRNPSPIIYDEHDFEFKFGRLDTIVDGHDVHVFAMGVPVSEAVKASMEAKKKGIALGVSNVSTIKPADSKGIGKIAKQSNALITVEDHQITGGLGSTVAEILSESGIARPFRRLGLPNRFAESGSPKDLYAKYKLNAEHILKAAEKLVKNA